MAHIRVDGYKFSITGKSVYSISNYRVDLSQDGYLEAAMKARELAAKMCGDKQYFVYFITREYSDVGLLYKVGYSAKVQKRMTALGANEVIQLWAFDTEKEARSFERQLLMEYDIYRMPNGVLWDGTPSMTEWMQLPPDVAREIACTDPFDTYAELILDYLRRRKEVAAIEAALTDDDVRAIQALAEAA